MRCLQHQDDYHGILNGVSGCPGHNHIKISAQAVAAPWYWCLRERLAGCTLVWGWSDAALQREDAYHDILIRAKGWPGDNHCKSAPRGLLHHLADVWCRGQPAQEPYIINIDLIVIYGFIHIIFIISRLLFILLVRESCIATYIDHRSIPPGGKQPSGWLSRTSTHCFKLPNMGIRCVSWPGHAMWFHLPICFLSLTRYIL